jgi:hypothetical protein
MMNACGTRGPASGSQAGCWLLTAPALWEAVKKSAIPVILIRQLTEKNLQLLVFRKINADASLRACDFFRFLAI